MPSPPQAAARPRRIWIDVSFNELIIRRLIACARGSGLVTGTPPYRQGWILAKFGIRKRQAAHVKRRPLALHNTAVLTAATQANCRVNFAGPAVLIVVRHLGTKGTPLLK